MLHLISDSWLDFDLIAEYNEVHMLYYCWADMSPLVELNSQR